MSYTLVEPCCGSAALTLHMLGAPQQLVPYQGSKWQLRRKLDALFVRLGYWGAPSAVWLGDVSPWAEVMATVIRSPYAVHEMLRPLVAEGERDPVTLYGRLHGGRVPEGCYQRAAELLWLQRMSFSGKAVGVRNGCWRSAGLNVSSALGTPATDVFGEVKPLGPALLRAVKSLRPFDRVFGVQGAVTPAAWKGGRAVVLLDPPYQGALGYPCGSMPRTDVVALAEAWHEAGATVIVCEAEAVAELVARGWTAECIQEGTGGVRGRMQAKARQAGARGWEWVTYRRSERAAVAA